MGVAGVVIGGSVLGLGAAAISQKKAKYSYASQVHSSMVPSLPTAPEVPSNAADNGGGGIGGDNALMEAERERQQQQAALQQQKAPEIFTSGLGAVGMAATAKKNLLGG